VNIPLVGKGQILLVCKGNNLQVGKGDIPLEWEHHFPAEEEEYHNQWGEIHLKVEEISQELDVRNLQD